MIKKWKKNSSKYLLENKIFKMREDSVTSPKLGSDHKVWVMEVPTWVNIIPLTPEGEVVLVNQYRFGTEQASLEIPGGMADPGENPKTAAVRELKEETGFESNEVIEIGRVESNPAIMSNHTYTYLALNCKKLGDQSLDGTEDIEIIKKHIDDIPKLIREGTIQHALVISAFYFYNLHQSN